MYQPLLSCLWEWCSNFAITLDLSLSQHAEIERSSYSIPNRTLAFPSFVVMAGIIISELAIAKECNWKRWQLLGHSWQWLRGKIIAILWSLQKYTKNKIIKKSNPARFALFQCSYALENFKTKFRNEPGFKLNNSNSLKSNVNLRILMVMM